MRYPTTSKRALVYTRSATRSPTESGNKQLRACEAYAREHGLTVVGHYDDHGSGLRAGEGLLAVCSDLQGGGVDAVVVRDASRISRDGRLLLDVLSLAARAGTKVISIEAGELNEDNIFVQGERRWPPSI